MIEKMALNLAVFAIIAIALSHGVKLNSNEEEARIFLNQASEKLNSLYDYVATKAFDYSDDYTFDEREAHTNYSIFLTSMVKDARKFDYKSFKDEELKHAFKAVLKKPHEKSIGEKRYLELFDSLKELESLRTENNTQEFKNKDNTLSYTPDISNILEKSNDPEELEYYWTALKELDEKWAEENFHITLEALKEAASLNDQSPLEFWSQGFNISDMEKILNDIRPLYLELHAFIRNLLHNKYGKSVIGPDGLIPEHLLEQVLKQLWSDGKNDQSPIEEMFPYEDLPPLESIVQEKFNGKQLYEIVDNFYGDLGFEKYPSSIWEDRFKMVDHDNCSSAVWVGSPKVFLEYCKKLHFWQFLDAYQEMGLLYNAKEMATLPGYYFDSPNQLDLAIGKAVSLSASTFHNLKAIGMIPESTKITDKVEINRLLRRAIRSLFYIPYNFVNAKVMADLLSGNITIDELSSHYWNLLDKHAGVGPTRNHKSHQFDLVYEFFDEVNDNIMSGDFYEEVLSYQIHKKLCEISEKFPKEPLHLCDISGSKKAGNALKKMMQLGSSKPFNEILATMFPENPTITADGLLEYYSPIKKLLAENNKDANAKLGWKSSSVDSDKS